MQEILRPMKSGAYTLRDRAICVADGIDGLCRLVADKIVSAANDAIAARGVFHIALSGGSTPVRLHQTLASAYHDVIDWDKFRVYFGDERYVAPEHPDSNFRMARETLLSRVPIAADQVFAMPTDCAHPADCAQRYADTLGRLPQQAGLPVFDMILLGMGDDGHTASLFPETDILNASATSVAAVFVPRLDSWRLSLTYPVLDRARNILVLVSGEGKSGTLFNVFNQPERGYPIQRIRNSAMQWCVDRAAARRLLESDVGISG